MEEVVDQRSTLSSKSTLDFLAFHQVEGPHLPPPYEASAPILIVNYKIFSTVSDSNAGYVSDICYIHRRWTLAFRNYDCKNLAYIKRTTVEQYRCIGCILDGGVGGCLQTYVAHDENEQQSNILYSSCHLLSDKYHKYVLLFSSISQTLAKSAS